MLQESNGATKGKRKNIENNKSQWRSTTLLSRIATEMPLDLPQRDIIFKKSLNKKSFINIIINLWGVAAASHYCGFLADFRVICQVSVFEVGVTNSKKCSSTSRPGWSIDKSNNRLKAENQESTLMSVCD